MNEPDPAALQPVVEIIPATTHGRYLVEPPASGQAAPLLVGFHGYAETADSHLGHLRLIPGSSGWLLTAIQGLHRFYRSKTGEVVASWMTRQDREHAIADNRAFVLDVVDRVAAGYPAEDCLVYAGFSQGAAMAYRAAARSRRRCEGLIVLGGDVPPEIGSDPATHLPPILLGRGRDDPWYTEDQLRLDLSVLAGLGSDVEVCRFEGGHEWGAEFLAAAGRFLDRRRATVRRGRVGS